MRPGTMRAYALGVLTGSVVTSLMVMFAAPAKADVSEDEAAMYSDAVCMTLADHSSTDGVLGIGLALRDEGYSGYEAGQIVGWAVINVCPEYVPILRAFSARYGSGRSIA